MFFMSFEHGATLSNVVNQVGREVWGDKFSQYRAEQQQQAVLKYLKTQPSLLIWDNFEPVAGFPAGNEPLLNASERDSLQRFLKDLRGGKSWVLITSRREERWLDCGYRLVDLRGLREQDVEELAAKILQTAGVDRAKLSPEYLELLKLLGGHPFSLRVVLPHLKTQTPKQLIEALRQGLDNLEKKTEEGRDKSLTTSLDYSFAKLSERTRRHLPFLALFAERVNAKLLHFFSEGLGADDSLGSKQVYHAVFGENLQKQDWLIILNEAVEAGILEHLDETIYKIHPALPWYLRQQLSVVHRPRELIQLEKTLLILYVGLADGYRKKLISNAEFAMLVVRVEEPNLLQNLRLAQQNQSWSYAQVILQALGEMYWRIGRRAEFRSLRQRILGRIGIHLAEAKAKGQDAFNFWMFLLGVDANEAAQIYNLQEARKIYQEILDELVALNDSSVVNSSIASINHNLGNISKMLRQFDEAIAFYQNALTIRENAGDFYGAAGDYNQIGIIAQEQGQFEKAITFYKKALKIYENANDFYKAASTYHNLGVVAHKQQHLDIAITYYNKSLKIHEQHGDFHQTAINCNQLGILTQEQGQLDKALSYYQKALQIYEDSGDFYGAASQYQNLGRIAREQQQFDEAKAYYQKALQIYEDAGDDYSAGSIYHNLGGLEHELNDVTAAIEGNEE
jgi:tetratricopeptide (TPR) repeat protein